MRTSQRCQHASAHPACRASGGAAASAPCLPLGRPALSIMTAPKTPIVTASASSWIRLGSLVALTSLTALFASCGGGGGSAGGPAPAPTPSADGPAWTQFGGDAQHAANAGIATQ